MMYDTLMGVAVDGHHIGAKLNSRYADTLTLMADADHLNDHFTAADRKVLIESAVLLELTRKDVSELKQNAPKDLASVREEARGSAEKLEARVRTLENFRWWLLGAVAFASPVLSALTAWLMSLISHH